MDSYLCIKQSSTESIKSTVTREGSKQSNFFNMSFLSFRAKSILKQIQKDFIEITINYIHFSTFFHNSSLSYKIFSGLQSIIHKEMLVLSIESFLRSQLENFRGLSQEKRFAKWQNFTLFILWFSLVFMRTFRIWNRIWAVKRRYWHFRFCLIYGRNSTWRYLHLKQKSDMI